MNILGISSFYHDSAAALVSDGQIRSAVQEERFSRKKHDHRFPRQAIEYCLSEAQLTPDQLDHVVFYDKPFVKFERLLETYLAYAPYGFRSFLQAIPLWIKEKLWIPDIIQKELDYEGSCAVDREILAKAKMQEYEKVDIYNVTNGNRFSTYLMSAEAGSRTVSINGAAAHKASPKDIIIICAYSFFNEDEAVKHKPTLVYFDQDNNIKSIKEGIPEQKL